MININSSSLFHFTSGKSIFEEIILKGLRYSFSCEYRPENVVPPNSLYSNKDNGITIPLISFCDIPLIRTSQHRKMYGDFCLGIDKQFLRDKLKDTLNMVSYYSSPIATQALCKLWESCENEKTKGLKELQQNPVLGMFPNRFVDSCLKQKELEFLLAFFKPCDNGKEGADYYDYTNEKEWRAVLVENKEKGCLWNMNSDKTLFTNEEGKESTISKEAAHMCNDSLGDNTYFYLQFSEKEVSEYVTHILLPTENDAKEFANYILKVPCLFGTKNPSEECRLNLIRRINSFEQIEKDF